MQIPEQCDVVVIGSGPAGSVAATALVQKGYDVVMLEKQSHPRYAVGENIIPDFWKYSDLIGVTPKLEAEGFLVKVGGFVNWQDELRAMKFSDFGYERPALHVERERFDHILAEHACEEGVRLFEQVTVSQVILERNEDGLLQVLYRHNGQDKQHGQIACYYVVDASGQSSVIARQLKLRQINEGFKFMSVWGYFEGSNYLAPDGRIHSEGDLTEVAPTTFVTSLDNGENGAGWAWHIRLRETTSVGFVLPMHIMKEERQERDWTTYFLEKCQTTPILEDLLANARFSNEPVRMIRNYSYRMDKTAGPGYFLVGDAAGFVDPIFSIGCVVGFYSGYVAAQMIHGCLQNPSSEEYRQALYTQQIQGRLELVRSLAMPTYQAQDDGKELAQTAVQFLSQREQALAQTAAILTNRSGNFDDLVVQNGLQEETQLHTFPTIQHMSQ